MKREPHRPSVETHPKADGEKGNRRSRDRQVPSICRVPQEQRTPGPDEVADIEALIQQMTEARDGLKFLYDLVLQEPLSEYELRSRSARLFAHGPHFVRATGRMLADDPQLFPDVPTDPRLLAVMQELAGIVRSITCHLGVLHRLWGDTHIDVQSTAISMANEVVKHVRGDSKRVFNRPDHMLERWLALAVVDKYLPTRTLGQKGKKGRGRRKKGE